MLAWVVWGGCLVFSSLKCGFFRQKIILNKLEGNMSETHHILLSVKGHPYERQAFYDIFDNMDNLDWTLVEQPASQALFNVNKLRFMMRWYCMICRGFFSMKMRIQILYLPLRLIKGFSTACRCRTRVCFFAPCDCRLARLGGV